MTGPYTPDEWDDLSAYDPEDFVKHPDYFDRITDQETHA